MTSFKQSNRLAVVAVCLGATALAVGPATAQYPDSATINGTIGSSVYGDHTWTLTLQGLSYSYFYEYLSDYNWQSITRVSATSFDFQFQGPHAAELNANVSEPFVNGGLQDWPVVELRNYAYWDTDVGYIDYARYWHIVIRPSDSQQAFDFSSWSFDSGLFAPGASASPVLAPFTILNAQTSLIDNRNGPGSGYTMGIMEGTVSVSSVGFSPSGDFDNDRDVDGSDFLAWQRIPSISDLADWQANFGTTPGVVAATSAVPEPASVLLLALAAAALRRRER
jgi:hypothetical protein